jgi:hypothetical protein
MSVDRTKHILSAVRCVHQNRKTAEKAIDLKLSIK